MTQVRKQLFMSLLTLVTVAVKAQASAEIIGHWKDHEQPKRLVEFYEGNKGLYYARIARDDENEALNGKVFIKKLKYDERSKSYEGLVSPLDSDAKVEIDATITWVDQDTLLVVVKNFFATQKIRYARVK